MLECRCGCGYGAEFVWSSCTGGCTCLLHDCQHSSLLPVPKFAVMQVTSSSVTAPITIATIIEIAIFLTGTVTLPASSNQNLSKTSCFCHQLVIGTTLTSVVAMATTIATSSSTTTCIVATRLEVVFLRKASPTSNAQVVSRN